MKKLTILVLLLAPAVVFGAFDYSHKVSPGKYIKVCVSTPPTFSLVNEDGDVAFEQYASRKPGKCAKVKTPKTLAPGTYTLKASEWGNVGKVIVGTVEVVAKKQKK